MEAYLRTTNSSDLPHLPSARSLPGLDKLRVHAVVHGNIIDSEVFQIALKTIEERKAISADTFYQETPSILLAKINLHCQICSSCRAKDVPLFTCACCGTLQVCSRACLRRVKTYLADHRLTNKRFP